MTWRNFRLVAGPIVVGFLSSLFGCGDGKTTSSELPEILSNTEEGFADLTFRVTEANQTRDGSWRIVAKARHRDQTVSLAVVLGGNWRKAALSGSMTTSQGRVKYESLGAESDALVSAIAEVFRADIHPASMVDQVSFTGLTLEGDPSYLASQPVKIKLFFESEKEGRYAEVYTNIDLPNKILVIREKDPEYRGPLLRAIGGID